jgi:oligopeptide/dipeptide ABC transporter ATP-binding protein
MAEGSMAGETMSDDMLLNVVDLKTHLPLDEGLLKAVDGVSFQIRQGKTLGIVGESGCGKSMTVLSIMRIAPLFARTSGQIWFKRRDGSKVDLVSLDAQGDAMRAIRGGEIAMIFQEPMTAFSPLHTIGNQIEEAIRLHRTPDKKEARAIAVDMLARVGISNPEQRIREYPHQLSGGMRQRAMIAMALSCEPSLLIADEPTTALDVTVQAQILNLLQDLQEEFQLTFLFIAHDLSVVEHIADRVAVMYVGRVVEMGATDDLYLNPKHPYTEALLSAVPKPDPRIHEEPIILAGEVANPANAPPGCAFHPRCRYAQARCRSDVPILREVTPGHWSACHFADELPLAGVIPE